MSNFHFANWEDIKDKDCQVFYPMYQVKIPGEKTYIHELIFDEEKLVKTPYGIIGSPIFSNPQFLRVFIYSEDIINYIKSDYFTNAFTFDLKNDKSFLCETDFNLHLNKKEILNNRKSIISFGSPKRPTAFIKGAILKPISSLVISLLSSLIVFIISTSEGL